MIIKVMKVSHMHITNFIMCTVEAAKYTESVVSGSVCMWPIT